MDAFMTIVISVMTSTVVVGLLAFLIKKYVGEAISYEFKQRFENDATVRKKEKERDKMFFEGRIGIYPELAEVTYRLRNIIVELPKSKFAYELNDELPVLSSHLTEFLFKYRFFLPQSLFLVLHDFKRVSQDTVLLLDVLTREEVIFDPQTIDKNSATLVKNAQKADELYIVIIEELAKVGCP
ncbi:hypothetical protein [Paraglaciecola sp.]|uniref:hypothetical protein n=1 Tax=Paraglaciecola sp. TaxID=1920173 RepID=UPI0030F3FDE7